MSHHVLSPTPSLRPSTPYAAAAAACDSHDCTDELLLVVALHALGSRHGSEGRQWPSLELTREHLQGQARRQGGKERAKQTGREE